MFQLWYLNILISEEQIKQRKLFEKAERQREMDICRQLVSFIMAMQIYYIIWGHAIMVQIRLIILRSNRTSMKVCNGAALGQVEYIGEKVQSQDKSSSIKW